MELSFEEGFLPEIANAVIQNCQAGDILAFRGDLATGKTTLIREIAKQMGYKGRVQSPTFVLERRYPVKFKEIRQIIHWDFYRLTDAEIAQFNFNEIFDEPNALFCIEWPERLGSSLPAKAKTISLKIINEKKRAIEFPDNFALDKLKRR